MGGSSMAGKGQEKGEPAVLSSRNFSAATGSQGDQEEDAVPDPEGAADTCKGGGMSCCLGRDPGEGTCTLNLEVIPSESGTSYCDCPSGLFLSRGREALSFVCSMFITPFPF